MVKGGTKSFEVVLTQELEFLAMLKGRGAQNVPTLKKQKGGGGGRKRLYMSWGERGAKGFGPTIFPCCSPPLPVISDLSFSKDYTCHKIFPQSPPPTPAIIWLGDPVILVFLGFHSPHNYLTYIYSWLRLAVVVVIVVVLPPIKWAFFVSISTFNLWCLQRVVSWHGEYR